MWAHHCVLRTGFPRQGKFVILLMIVITNNASEGMFSPCKLESQIGFH